MTFKSQKPGIFTSSGPGAAPGLVTASLCALVLLAGCSAPEEPAAPQEETASLQDQAAPVETPSLSEPATGVEPATLQRRIEVNAAPAEVWAIIGPFCSLADWHPMAGSCTVDDNTPPTRTIVTADGTAVFVETEYRRNDPAYIYSYRIISGPLPVSDYQAMFRVEANAAGGSEIIWSSVYTPDAGAEAAAEQALAGIYESGLDAIAAAFTE